MNNDKEKYIVDPRVELTKTLEQAKVARQAAAHKQTATVKPMTPLDKGREVLAVIRKRLPHLINHRPSEEYLAKAIHSYIENAVQDIFPTLTDEQIDKVSDRLAEAAAQAIADAEGDIYVFEKEQLALVMYGAREAIKALDQAMPLPKSSPSYNTSSYSKYSSSTVSYGK